MTNHKSGAHDNAKTANDSAVDNTDDDLVENNSNLLISDEAEEEAEESNLFDPEDDQDLNDAFEELSQELARHEEEIENNRLQQKIERFKVLINKKTRIQKDTLREVANLKQIETHHSSVIQKKEKEISSLKKSAMKAKEKYAQDIDSLRKSNSNTIKENADLNAKLTEKESIIVSLEEALAPDTSDDVEEVIQMNRNTSGHKCTACN